jgi:Membrane protein involved in colicin uptake
MKHRVAAFAFAFLFALVSTNVSAQSGAGGLSPDRGELESASGSNLVFVSYEGPASKIDSLADIKGIGSGLGKSISANAPSSSGAGGAAAATLRAGDDRRYAVIRAIDPSSKEGLDADIIVIGPDSQVDHIRNLRWIVASYLVAAWGYSEKDASTLATFVTVYNAVHRGDLKYFGSKYKPVVQKELSSDNAGLALKYTDWPGKTRMLVPLSSGAKAGSLGAIDTGAVSDKAVKDSLKAEPGKGVSDRQALVDVKEREAAQKQAEADKKKAEADAAAAKLAQDKAKAEADRAALEKEKVATAQANASPNASGGTGSAAASPNAAASASAGASTAVVSPNASSGAANPSETASPNASTSGAGADKGASAATAGGEASAASLSTKEAAVAAEEQKVKEDEKAVAAKKEEASAAQAAATSKKEEAAADRKEIASDQKEVIAAEVAQKGEAAAKGVFLIRVDPASQLGQIFLVDTAKGSTIRASRLNSIHLRSIAQLSDAFVAVVGLADKAGGVKLEKIDKASLESIAEGKADLYPESALLSLGDSLYAVVKGDDGKYYVAKFAASDLSEKARGKDAVLPFGLISEAAGSIAVQAADASFLLLKPDTLEKDKVLKPLNRNREGA